MSIAGQSPKSLLQRRKRITTTTTTTVETVDEEHENQEQTTSRRGKRHTKFTLKLINCKFVFMIWKIASDGDDDDHRENSREQELKE